MARPSKGIQCCEGCGRDCRGRYCGVCIGAQEDTRRLPDRRSSLDPKSYGPIEDDYGEESDAEVPWWRAGLTGPDGK